MPFTPFHLGPGLAAKAMLGSGFSLTLFGIAQVAMDIEPLIRLVRGDMMVHGWTHSYLGATLVAGVVLVLGRPLAQWWLRYLGRAGEGFTLALPEGEKDSIPWTAAWSGACIGCYSHVLLDSLMHGDMRPLLPWSADNPWLYDLSLETLHLLCLGSGLFGVGVLWLRYRRWRASRGRPGRSDRE